MENRSRRRRRQVFGRIQCMSKLVNFGHAKNFHRHLATTVDKCA